MPPKLLPKAPNEPVEGMEAGGTDFEEEVTGIQSGQKAQDTRNFEFINAIGTMRPNAASRPSIRSHVMREANRLTYSSNPSRYERSSSQGSSHSEGSMLSHIQRFRMSPSGFRPVEQSRRSRKGPLRSTEHPSSTLPILEDPSRNFQWSDQETRLSGPNSVMTNANDIVPFLTKSDQQDIPPQTYEMSSSGHLGYGGSVRPAPSLPDFTISFQPATIRGEQMDPFNALPVPSSPRTQVLLRRYQVRTIESTPLMMAARRQWFAEAIQDPAFLLIKLCYAAGNLFTLSNLTDSVESLTFQNEAIKIINQRLDESPDRISEATVGTVASIVSYESINGSLESTQIHINGLQQMIKARGGLKKENCGPGLLRLIAWADIQSANALSTLPRFPPIDILLKEISASSTPSNPQDNFRARTLSSLPWVESTNGDIPYATVLEERVHIQFMKLKNFVDYINYINYIEPAHATSNGESSQFWLSDAIYDIQRGFILELHELQDVNGIDQCCCIAGLIYVEYFLRNVNPNTKIVVTLNERLQDSIIKLNSVFEWGPGEGKSNLLLWALFIGAATSTQVHWFAEKLSALIRLMGVRDLDDMMVRLKEIVFPEKLLQHSVKFVWDQVMEYQK